MRVVAILLACILLAAACGQALDPAPTDQPATTPPTTSPTAVPTASAPPESLDLITEISAEAPRAPADAANDAVLRALLAGDTEFAFRLYREIVATRDGNVFLSPYSISTALSMAYAGARGQTAEQMAAVLGIEISPEEWHAARNRLELEMIEAAATMRLESGEPLKLEPTNGIFGQAGYPFEDEYLRVLASYYGAGMQTVNFASSPEAARGEINDWVAEKTHDRIEELLAEGTIDSLTRAVLVNAIYFKGSWMTAFEPDRTRPLPFHLLDGSRAEVDMMQATIETQYATGDGWVAVRLPYFGASMLVVVPDPGHYAEVEGQLSPAFLAGLRRDLAAYEVDLDLPKWESESEIQLGDVLRGLGIVDAFDPEPADFSGMAPDEDLHISDVIHQANITVDEEGTEAAAATAVVMRTTSAAPEPKRVSLSVDRPFFYLIEDGISGAILFMGRLLAP